MKSPKYLALVYSFIYLITLDCSSGQESSIVNVNVNLSDDWSYCWEFTWFGPEYDNITRYNGTCTDYLDETRAKNVPCSAPIVITYNGTPPDMNYLWKHHKNSVLCKRGSTQMCARYTYRINGIINNATYMCTKVRSIGTNQIGDGCYKEMVNGYEVELCLCKSGPGIYKPCNAAINLLSSSLWTFLLTALIFIYANF